MNILRLSTNEIIICVYQNFKWSFHVYQCSVYYYQCTKWTFCFPTYQMTFCSSLLMLQVYFIRTDFNIYLLVLVYTVMFCGDIWLTVLMLNFTDIAVVVGYYCTCHSFICQEQPVMLKLLPVKIKQNIYFFLMNRKVSFEKSVFVEWIISESFYGLRWNFLTFIYSVDAPDMF